MNGVLVIDKPGGWTSHDVVAKVKGALRASKVGHLGTLDPIATGALPLVVNRATKYARFLEGSTKEYTGTMRLGSETDTYDREGTVTATGDTSGVTEEAVREAFSRFTGAILQTPPMYSSVKKGGVPLYKLARKGVTVAREPKEVEVSSFEVTDVDLPDVAFSVACSKGTYVRTLCHDVGEVLGCGAHLLELRRTASGVFPAEGAPGPEDSKEVLAESVIPLDKALELSLGELPSVTLDHATLSRVKRGGTVTARPGRGFFASLKRKEMVRFLFNGTVVAVSEYLGTGEDGATGFFKVIKTFHDLVIRAGVGGEYSNKDIEFAATPAAKEVN